MNYGHLEAYSSWCGPNVLASVTGLTRYHAAGVLWAITPPTGRRRNITNIHTLAVALGFPVSQPVIPDGPKRRTYRIPTVAKWLRENPDREAILLAAQHFIHVREGEIVACGGSPVRRGRVHWLIDLWPGGRNDDGTRHAL